MNCWEAGFGLCVHVPGETTDCLSEKKAVAVQLFSFEFVVCSFVYQTNQQTTGFGWLHVLIPFTASLMHRLYCCMPTSRCATSIMLYRARVRRVGSHGYQKTRWQGTG